MLGIKKTGTAVRVADLKVILALKQIVTDFADSFFTQRKLWLWPAILSTEVLLSNINYISGTNLQSREHPQTVWIHFCCAECGEVATFVIQQYMSISIFCIFEFGTLSFSSNFLVCFCHVR